MSQSFAEKVRRQMNSGKAGKNATAIIIFGAITLVFVFFGLPGKNGGIGIGYVARVNNALISIADFQTQERQVSEQMSQLFGGQMPFGAQQNQFKQQALNQLIRYELANQAAQKEGIVATDAEIRDYIMKDIPVFQENGQFVKERYNNYLAYMHMSAGDFETKLRKEINNLRLARLFEAATVSNSLEDQHQETLKSQKMNLQFLKLDREALIDKRVVPNDVIAKNLADIGFRKRVEDRFNIVKSRYDQPAQVKAQHILIMAKNGDDAALKKIEDIKKQVTAANFGQLAQKYSDDPQSAKKGGDLGYFTEGRMTPEFEKAAFGAKPGEIVGPVKTEFGYHLIKVTDKKPAKAALINEYDKKIAAQLINDDLLDKSLKDLAAAVEAGKYDAVAAFQKEWGVNWQETGFFDMSQDYITQLPIEDISFVSNLTPEKPWVNQLLGGQGGGRYIVKLKEEKTEKVDPAKAAAGDNNHRQKSFAFYDGFIRQFEKGSTIQVNQEALR